MSPDGQLVEIDRLMWALKRLFECCLAIVQYPRRAILSEAQIAEVLPTVDELWRPHPKLCLSWL